MAILISYRRAIQACKKLMYVPRGWASGFIIHPYLDLTLTASKMAAGKAKRKMGDCEQSRFTANRMFSLSFADFAVPYSLCTDVPPPSEKNRGKRRLWIAVVNRVPVYICINYCFFCFFSDSWKGFDRPTRLWTLLEHVRSYSRGTQRLFSVKYLFGDANIA